jgi:hypothetical protein
MSKIVLTDEASAPAIPTAGTTVIYTAGGVLQVLNSGGVPAAPILPSIFTATGQLLYASGASTPAALTIGTAGQVLTVNSGATAPEWVNPPTFVAGTTNSTAQYRSATAIQDAITAAAAAITGGLAAATVEILPGNYTENLTLPANVSLVASGGFGSVSITGTVTLTATSGRNSLSGLYIEGRLTCNASGATTAEVPLNQCYIDTNAGAFPAITVSDDGWVIRIDGCTLDSSTSAGQNTVTLATDPSGTELSAKNCTFVTEAAGLAISGSLSDGTFEGCTFNRPFAITTSLASSLQLTNTVFNLTSTPSTVAAFAGGGNLALNILGSFGISGLAPTGTLFTGAGVTASAGTTGTFLGTYQTANLPTLSGNDGVLAYSSDDNALYVRRSAAWEKVASQSNDNTWNASSGQQTFYTTQFMRAAIPDAVNGGALYNLVATSAPLVRMDTAGGPKTVTLFSPGVGDIGKQWVVFDAARDASTLGPITINLLVGTDTLNGSVGGTVTISTDGGALVFRVTGANAWETIGY